VTAVEVAAALGALCPGAVTHAAPVAAPDASAAVTGAGLGPGAVAHRVGDALLLVSSAAAQRLAAVLMGAPPGAPPPPPGALTDLERATVADALAGALGGEPGLLAAGSDAVATLAAEAASATVTDLVLCGEPARLVELSATAAPEDRFGAIGLSLRSTTVRVSAEIGRARLPAERVVGAAPGSIVELDRDADEPIDLYVNGRRFALGRLELTPAGEWAVRVERVLDPDEA